MNNVVEKFKKGYKIHIKESQKGSFTKYCGGNVTNECIQKGKNSSDPKIRKKATFAANARKWKHQQGGIVLSPEEQRYLKWRNMTPKQQQTYRINRAKAYFDDGQLWNAAKSYFGGFDPKNPRLNQMTVENAPLPGKVNMSLYKDAKTVLKGSQYNEKFVNFIDRIVSGKGPIKGSPYFDAVDLKSETIPRGFIKGNEVTPIKGYPISEENLTIRTAKPINLENPITNEAEAQAARDWIATYGKKGKYKQGGKAFVNGVSILDSNPDAYKYVKKKLKKHQEGGKTSTWQKIGNFFNSDTGKRVIGLGSQIFNGLKTGLDVANFSNSFDLATDSRVKAMESKMRETSYQKGLQKAKEFIAQKQLENPDIRYGEIDLINLAQNFSNEFYDSDAIEDYKTQRAQEKFQSMQAIQGSAGNSINLLDSLGGIASKLLNSNSNTTSGKTSSTAVQPKLTTNKYTPSTSLSNPVLGNNAQGYMPDWSFLLNSSKPK